MSRKRPEILVTIGIFYTLWATGLLNTTIYTDLQLLAGFAALHIFVEVSLLPVKRLARSGERKTDS